MIFNNSEKSLIVDHANSPILGCIFLSNCERFVFAAIVHNGVVPVSVRLPENALDAFSEVLRAVVYGCQYAHAGLQFCVHILFR
jgi:hypothetical protein